MKKKNQSVWRKNKNDERKLEREIISRTLTEISSRIEQ